MKVKYYALICLSAVLLGGCASQKTMEPPKGSNQPLYELSSQSESVQRNMHILTSISSAEVAGDVSDANWNKFMFNMQAIPAGLDRRVTVSYTQNLGNVLSNLASLAGYTLSVQGQAPEIIIPVSIQLDNEPLIDGFRDINAALGNAGDIFINGASRTIMLQWNRPGQMAQI